MTSRPKSLSPWRGMRWWTWPRWSTRATTRRWPTACRRRDWTGLRASLSLSGVKLHGGAEPFEETLTRFDRCMNLTRQRLRFNLLITLPPWVHPEKRKDNWQAGPWDRAIQATAAPGRARAAAGRSFLEELSAVSSQALSTACLIRLFRRSAADSSASCLRAYTSSSP